VARTGSVRRGIRVTRRRHPFGAPASGTRLTHRCQIYAHRSGEKPSVNWRVADDRASERRRDIGKYEKTHLPRHMSSFRRIAVVMPPAPCGRSICIGWPSQRGPPKSARPHRSTADRSYSPGVRNGPRLRGPERISHGNSCSDGESGVRHRLPVDGGSRAGAHIEAKAVQLISGSRAINNFPGRSSLSHESSSHVVKTRPIGHVVYERIRFFGSTAAMPIAAAGERCACCRGCLGG
jgi:hypothetical protein